MAGSRWLQLNVYAPPARQDTLLVRGIGPAVGALVQSRQAERWFFIQYADRGRRGGSPRHHLRLRLLPSGATLRGVERRLRAQLDRHGSRDSFRDVRRAIYRAETTRYGGPRAIGLAEQVFCIDSGVTLEVVMRSAGGKGRASAAVQSMETLLGALGLDRRARRSVYGGLARYYLATREFGPVARHALEELYRARRDALLGLLADGRPRLEGDDFLASARAQLRPVGTHLRALECEDRLTRPVRAIAASFAHMHCNRLGMGMHQEAVFTWCLWRATRDAW